MSRRMMAFLLALVMAFGLIGCGSKPSDTTSGSKKEESSTNTPDDNKKEEPSKETERRPIRYTMTERWDAPDGQTYEGYEEATYTYDSNGNIAKEDFFRKDVDDFEKETTYYTYDSNNNVIKEERVDSDGNSIVTTFTYDAQGRLITEDWNGVELTKYSYHPNGVLQMEEETERSGYYSKTMYNEAGDVIYQESHLLSGQTYFYEYIYDEQGNLVKKRHTQSDRPDTEETTYTYDANGNLLQEKKTASDGYTRTVNYTYDANGNLLQEKENTSSGYTSTNTWTYDSNGNELTYSGREEYPATQYSDAEIITYLFSFTYDAQGNKLTETANYRDGSFGHTVYTYDAEGNVLTEVTTGYDSDGNDETYSTTYTYEYEEYLVDREPYFALKIDDITALN